MIRAFRNLFSDSRWRLSLALSLVFGLRLLYVCSLPNKIDSWRDGASYDDIARNLISGAGYRDKTDSWRVGHETYAHPPFADPFTPTARWMPGYPLFIVVTYLVCGESYRAVYIAQAVLGVIIAGFIYLLSKYMIGRRAGILAVFLYAVDFLSIHICGTFQTEQLFTCFVVVSVYCFLRIANRGQPDIFFTFLFGLVAGIGVLTRNVAGLMFAGFCLALLLGWTPKLKHNRLSTRVWLIGIASVGFLGSLSPWIVRNQKLTGSYVLSTETWQTLAMANNDKGGVYYTLDGLSGMPQTFLKEPEIEREAIYRKFVLRWIMTHFTDFSRLYLKRLVYFWSPFLHETTGIHGWLGFVFNLLLLVFATSYVICQHKDWRRLIPIYIMLLTGTFGYSLAFVTTRFRLPLYPLMEILAAGGIISLSETRLPYKRQPD